MQIIQTLTKLFLIAVMTGAGYVYADKTLPLNFTNLSGCKVLFDRDDQTVLSATYDAAFAKDISFFGGADSQHATYSGKTVAPKDSAIVAISHGTGLPANFYSMMFAYSPTASIAVWSITFVDDSLQNAKWYVYRYETKNSSCDDKYKCYRFEPIDETTRPIIYKNCLEPMAL